MPGRILSLVSAFRRDLRGNAAISFGIVSIPGMIAVALTIDYAATTAVRAGLHVSGGDTAFVRALNFGTGQPVGPPSSVSYIVSTAISVATATFSKQFVRIPHNAIQPENVDANLQRAAQIRAGRITRSQ